MPSIVKLTLESNQYERNIKNAQKQLNDFTKSIGINMKSLSGMAVAAGAVTGALKVMKDAFFKSETALDEWGRTVESSKSLYSGFLSALNNSDISGFISQMSNIVSAAREAYDAMDDLATYNAFSRGRTAGLRSNYSSALNEYKLNPTAENKKALKAANDALIAEMQIQAGKQKTNYEKQLTSLGIDRMLKGEQLNEFMNLFKSGDYDKLQTLKSAYKSGRGLNTGAQYWYGDRVYDGKIQDRFTGKWSVMDEDERKQFEFARVLNQVNDKQIDSIQALDEQYKMTLDAINNQNRQYNRLAGNNGKVGGATVGSTKGTRTTKAQGITQAEIDAKIAQQWNTASIKTASMSGSFKVDDSGPSDVFKALTANVQEAEDSVYRLTNAFGALNEAEQKAGTFKPVELEKGGKAVDLSWSMAATAVSSVGNALHSIDDPAAQIMGTIAMAIANVAAAAGQAVSAKDTTASGWAWIGAAAAITASMVAMIATIHSATGYAQGGIVDGRSYSGDNIPILANAGEIVLSKSMQNNLANALQGNGLGGLNLTASISGEMIRLSLNHNGMRTGRGEYVTTKFQ